LNADLANDVLTFLREPQQLAVDLIEPLAEFIEIHDGLRDTFYWPAAPAQEGLGEIRDDFDLISESRCFGDAS
jgi:hypothetical protein